MALYYTLPIYRDVYQLILKLFEATHNFSREYKYTLGQDIKRDGISLVRNIYKANKYKEKEGYLNELQEDLEVLKLQIRLAKDLNVVSTKKYAEICRITEKIGRQLTGWKKKHGPGADSF